MDTMTENDYLIAWGLYAFAALGCLLVWMRMTRWMWRYLREPLRVIVAVLLFSPTIIDPVKEKFAPAIAITALDLLFKVGNNAWRAVSDLFMYGMIVFGLYLIFVLIRFPIERAASARKEKAAAAKAASAKAASRTLLNMRFDEVTITIEDTNKSVREFYTDKADVMLIFTGEYDGGKRVDMRMVKMVAEKGKWLISEIKPDPFARAGA